MTTVGTVNPMNGADLASSASFDVSTPLARAKLLVALRSHANEFTAEEHKSYDAFRDALTRVARGEEEPQNLEVYATALGHFLGVANVVIGTKEESEKAPLMDAVVTHPAHDSLVDFSEATASAPVAFAPVDTPSAPVAQSVTPPVPQQDAPLSQPARGRRGPDVVPAMVAQTPEPLPAQTPTPISSPAPTPSVTESVVSPVLAEPVVVPSPREVSEPVAEVVAGTQEVDLLANDVEAVNDALNTFAHGTAFKWLSDASTGYRTYLNELLLLRSTFAEMKVKAVTPIPPNEYQALQERVSGLHKMADAVREAVGAPRASAPATTQVDAAPVKETGKEVVDAPTDAQDKLSDSPQPSSPESGQASSPLTPSRGAVPEASIEPAPAETVYVNRANPMEIPVASSIEPESETQQEEVISLNTENAVESQAPAQEQKPIDRLMLPEIETGLNELLVHWLGSTGFLGFGDSGVKHPDWLVMRSLYVDDVLTGDGVIPQGIRPDIYANLGDNIRAWKRTYGLLEFDGETIEHFIRRVVDSSMVIKPA